MAYDNSVLIADVSLSAPVVSIIACFFFLLKHRFRIVVIQIEFKAWFEVSEKQRSRDEGQERVYVCYQMFYLLLTTCLPGHVYFN